MTPSTEELLQKWLEGKPDYKKIQVLTELLTTVMLGDDEMKEDLDRVYGQWVAYEKKKDLSHLYEHDTAPNPVGGLISLQADSPIVNDR